MNAINSLFGKSCELELQIDTEPNRKTVQLKSGLPGVRAIIFSDGEDVCGTAKVASRAAGRPSAAASQ